MSKPELCEVKCPKCETEDGLIDGIVVRVPTCEVLNGRSGHVHRHVENNRRFGNFFCRVVHEW